VANLQTDVFSFMKEGQKKFWKKTNYKRNKKQGVDLKLATPSNLAFS